MFTEGSRRGSERAKRENKRPWSKAVHGPAPLTIVDVLVVVGIPAVGTLQVWQAVEAVHA
jgi:hypothetical protein